MISGVSRSLNEKQLLLLGNRLESISTEYIWVSMLQVNVNQCNNQF